MACSYSANRTLCYCVTRYENFAVNQKSSIFVSYVIKEFAHAFSCAYIELWYTCQLSRLRRESHACGLKTSISRPLTPADQFLTPNWKMWVVAVLLDTISKNMYSDPCKERKPCVKWINDNTFLAISDFVDKCFLDNFAFGRLRTSSEDFGLLRESSEMIVSFSKIPALPG